MISSMKNVLRKRSKKSANVSGSRNYNVPTTYVNVNCYGFDSAMISTEFGFEPNICVSPRPA